MLTGEQLAGEQNPFLRYRERLDSYRAVADGSLVDSRYVELVEGLDAAVRDVVGTGFCVSPVIDGSGLAAAAEIDVDLFIKVEVDNVAGSHKARHLFGVALHLLVHEALGGQVADRLAIASCGNAALGAAVVARALGRDLDVFVPVWADESVVQLLNELDTTVTRCERRPGEAGDPSYLRFRESVADGARPFSVQGTDTPTTFDGGRTLGWELAEQVGALDALYIQVGGCALATAVSLAIPDARLHPVQAQGCAPLRTAWDRLAPEFDFADAATHPGDFMEPWPGEPTSIATGILDDVTYDWQPLLKRTKESGGHPIVVPEQLIEGAYSLAQSTTGLSVSATGTAGFAGLLQEPPTGRERVAVLFTGIDRP